MAAKANPESMKWPTDKAKYDKNYQKIFSKENKMSNPKDDMRTVASYLAEYLSGEIERTHKAGLPVDFSKEGLDPIISEGLKNGLDKMGLEIRVKKWKQQLNSK